MDDRLFVLNAEPAEEEKRVGIGKVAKEKPKGEKKSDGGDVARGRSSDPRDGMKPPGHPGREKRL